MERRKLRDENSNTFRILSFHFPGQRNKNKQNISLSRYFVFDLISTIIQKKNKNIRSISVSTRRSKKEKPEDRKKIRETSEKFPSVQVHFLLKRRRD
jgi:hypothetical protein